MMSNKIKNNQDANSLIKTIDELKEQKERIENKFRDLTHAYKSILAEKKALEITIAALKTKTPKSNLVTVASNGLSASSRSISDLSEQESNEPLSDSSSIKNITEKLNEAGQNTDNSDAKVAALTTNIQVLLDSKSKLEASYVAEKKKLRADLEDLKTKYDNLKNENDKINQNYESKLKELRTSLKQSQLEREKLSMDLNNLIKLKSSEQESKIMSMNEENQQILFNLRNENNDLKLKIKNINKQFDNKCEQVVQCENEIKMLKTSHDEQLKKDEADLNDLRGQLKQLASSSERRIEDLEANISQLCLTIANYENNSNSSLNFKYSLNNSILNKSSNENNETNPQPTDIDSAVEQITQLKKFVEAKAKDLNIEFNLNDIWSQNSTYSLQVEKEKQKELQTQIENLKEENRHLREEYEKYKIRTNYLIKSAKQASVKDSSSTNNETELRKFKQEVDSFKMRLIVVEREKLDEIEKIKLENDNFVSQLRNEFKTQLDKLESIRLKSINDLEKELVKQRERTFKLLAEKESELEKYKFGKHLNSNNNKNNNKEEGNKTDSSESLDMITSTDDIIPNDIEEHSNDTDNNNQSSLIYYSQQNAYKDSELNKLRQAKLSLEYKLKQTIDENSVEADRFQSQINILKQEIERLKLNTSRNELNGSNLEYIKNVVFNYMTTKDNNIKTNLINSIVQILHFTKAEKQKIQSFYSQNL